LENAVDYRNGITGGGGGGGGREESHNFQGNKTVCSCQVQFIIIQKILVCGYSRLILASQLIQRKFKVGFLIDITL